MIASTELLCLQINCSDNHCRILKYTISNSLADDFKKEGVHVVSKMHHLNLSYITKSEGDVSNPLFHFLTAFNFYLIIE